MSKAQRKKKLEAIKRTEPGPWPIIYGIPRLQPVRSFALQMRDIILRLGVPERVFNPVDFPLPLYSNVDFSLLEESEKRKQIWFESLYNQYLELLQISKLAKIDPELKALLDAKNAHPNDMGYQAPFADYCEERGLFPLTVKAINNRLHDKPGILYANSQPNDHSVQDNQKETSLSGEPSRD